MVAAVLHKQCNFEDFSHKGSTHANRANRKLAE